MKGNAQTEREGNAGAGRTCNAMRGNGMLGIARKGKGMKGNARKGNEMKQFFRAYSYKDILPKLTFEL